MKHIYFKNTSSCSKSKNMFKEIKIESLKHSIKDMNITLKSFTKVSMQKEN
jgi:hypothetical protein